MSSTRTPVTLLRLWIRRFTIIISAWWLRTSSKFTWEEIKTLTGKLGKWSTPKRVRIRPKYSAPSLSRDRRIKMHQSIIINQKCLRRPKVVTFYLSRTLVYSRPMQVGTVPLATLLIASLVLISVLGQINLMAE